MENSRPGASFPVTDNAGAGGDLDAAGSGEMKEPWYRPDLEKAGTHFFCESCLGHKPLDDRSPDGRYCQWCYDFLIDEAEQLPPKKRPAWIPKIEGRKTIPVPHDVVLIMSTTNDQNIYSGHNSPAAPPIKPCGKRGPKHRDLPEDLIKELAAQGKGAKAIAGELKKENDITVSYKTVERILKGQRVMI